MYSTDQTSPVSIAAIFGFPSWGLKRHASAASILPKLILSLRAIADHPTTL
ncbi:hypothetical protein [Spirulina major]|uniref:hypothetical protein n=1 Tax=Spirulina major TaxID=270636 RepID=UPI0015870400|nr:hypothetical protein [Spirulina major]